MCVGIDSCGHQGWQAHLRRGPSGGRMCPHLLKTEALDALQEAVVAKATQAPITITFQLILDALFNFICKEIHPFFKTC